VIIAIARSIQNLKKYHLKFKSVCSISVCLAVLGILYSVLNIIGVCMLGSVQIYLILIRKSK